MVGAVGATTLSFIMPCLLHLRLFRGELGAVDRAADMLTAGLGATAGVLGLITTVHEWVAGG